MNAQTIICSIVLSVSVFMLAKVFWPVRKPVAPTPKPSDILAGMLAIRMMADPSAFSLHGSKGSWYDRATQIRITFDLQKYPKGVRGPTQWVYYFEIDEFSRDGKAVATTDTGKMELNKAAKYCRAFNLEQAEAKRQYEGDMVALDAIEVLLKVKAA